METRTYKKRGEVGETNEEKNTLWETSRIAGCRGEERGEE